MLKKALATVVVRPDAASPLAGRRPAVSARASSNASPGGGMRGSHVARRTASVTLRTLSSRRPHPPAGAPTGRPHRLARGRAQVTTNALFGKKPPASPSPSKDVSVSVRDFDGDVPPRD
jgi:hypothetical protein